MFMRGVSKVIDGLTQMACSIFGKTGTEFEQIYIIRNSPRQTKRYRKHLDSHN